MTKAAAIHLFWSDFGLNAYEENAVPDDAKFPYITYQFVSNDFDKDTAMTGSLWYRGSSWVEANAKAQLISDIIGLGGKIIPCDGGAVWIKRGSPFAQNMGDESDNMIKRKYINIVAEYFTAN